ncbi:MAG TPA: hypothetical protein VL995_14275 [Cellvibrio sp.]|nr:hypothetical protein [Cellvibrio sp.]
MSSEHFSEKIIEIEHILGVELDKKLAGTVSNLNEIPSHIILECNKLKNPYHVECLIRFYVTDDNEKYLRQFVHTVIFQKRDHKNWKKGRILLPDTSLKDQLEKSLSEIYQKVDVLFDLIVSPQYVPWEQGVNTLGSFAVVESMATYKSPLVPGFISTDISNEHLITVSPDKKQIWFRRWIASRIARYLHRNQKLQIFNDASVLSEISPQHEWTPDAIIAFKGLLKERDLNLWNDKNIPGYVGDDSIYCLESKL